MTTRQIISHLLIGTVCLALGFFTGREELRYEMRSAMQTALRGASTLVGGSSLGEANKPGPPRVSKPNEPAPLALTLRKKGFKASDPSADDFEDDITIELEIKNLTGKEIRAFDGIITFTDLLDNPIMSSDLAINERIQAGSTLIWDGAIKYNQFIDSHQRLRNEAQDNLKLMFTPKKILFEDGTVENYDDR